jgi:hypothetical protein
MRREWFRSATVGAPSLTVAPSKVAQARAALDAAPDERAKHKELARLLAQDGSLGELEEELGRWSAKDPLDPDVIATRADLAARRGQRMESLRILSGVLDAPASARKQLEFERALAVESTRLGVASACSFWVAVAELSPKDVDAVAHAASCERAAGHPGSERRWLATLPSQLAEDKELALLAKYDDPFGSRTAPVEHATWGDVMVDASWEEGRDLDVVIIDPSGKRQSWSSSDAVKVEDPRSMRRESIALASSLSGSFLIEIVRTDGADLGGPVRGTVRIKSHGVTQTRSFVLDGDRAEVARLDLKWESRLVPIETDAVF